MSISSAMNAAISGLRATALGSEVVSTNISNALTPSYGARQLDLASMSNGTAGVSINGISRRMDEGIVSDLRAADAAMQNSQSAVDFFTQVEDIVGLAGDEYGLNGRLAAFEESLIDAASRPDVSERLSAAVSSASRLAEGISDASAEIQEMRTRADTMIAQDVATLNSSLEQVRQLNVQIASTGSAGTSDPTLFDQRQEILDTIGSIVPINVVPKENGAVTIYSEGGAILLDLSAAEFGFDKRNLVTEHQTLEAGTLSGLTMNGQDIKTSALGGGSLSGYFDVRDDFGVEAQTKLDVIARDLVERFQDPSLDSTLNVGDAGLFTDAGAAFDPANEVGLSRRLTLNQAVDPDAGGETWRLRDGLGASTVGAVGDASLLNSYSDSIEASRVPSSSGLGTVSVGFADLIATFSGELATSRSVAEQDLSFTSARHTELTEVQLSQGVDTDQELQNLLVLEQAYAANARVIQAASEMLDTLMGL
ncbi:flagellar hook-associated protein FlgK [Sulfitobacter donghicola]|uniref:Flagellar hook-associated protein 1 n=1 Tax=Sulfitobacter donghicola DSW-25 = KCTC 12864 = JCM 14565 TaxID=1300350 RepID=A0A073ILW2_9RHOB|nr:flagellar hook-associated protein FlgK [Sulfitobacter donghicola]KEJ90535.1 flagellar hook protein FlgK [Sulfitobacter donghicola DSW-25 = KCTC 12864 = JCM 14565]KIN67777.1 Flagellar hook-associated protein FlgK [Sulfitobacter donghicola DSW-25 = KCTC 12864 = JCM 14565]